jgi:hypothetical protein
LDASLFYWSKAKYPKFRISIITHQQDLDTQKIVSNYLNLLNINLIIYSGDKKNHKGFLIKHAIDRIRQTNDYIILSDADMIFEQNVLERTNISLNKNDNRIISSIREDISSLDINLFLENFRKEKELWPWEDLRKESSYRSSFMGWFLVFPSKYIKDIDFIGEHNGYDYFDWKIYGQLINLKLEEKLIYFDYTPLHLFHGEKGKNWKGIEEGIKL